MNGNHIRRNLGSLAAIIGLGLISASVMAEDIEVFFTNSANNVAPNVLFILDASGSMDEISGVDSRIDILKNALGEVLKPTPKYKQLNVGIMDFNGNKGGGIDFPVTDINSDANLVDSMIPVGTDGDVGSVVDFISQSYTASGFTPMGDALYFASSYYSGTKVFYNGWDNIPYTWDTATNSYSDGNGDPKADNPAAYTGTIGFTTTQQTDVRNCSTSAISPVRACGLDTASSAPICKERSHDHQAKARQYRIRTYSCDSTGKECKWDSPSYKDIDASYPGDSFCSRNKPSNAVDGTTWVQCESATAATSYKYQFCQEDYTYDEKTWGSAPVYNSPISKQCQKNYIVMLSDGEPTKRNTLHQIANRVKPITNSTSSYSNAYKDCLDLTAAEYGNSISENGRCLPELTKYMATIDQSGTLAGPQTVTTHTIGFALGADENTQKFLKLLAREGKGSYYDANSTKGLTDAFKEIIRDAMGKDVSFSSPSVNIDQNNRLATSEYLYRADFTPSDKPRWNGDIVKVKIGKDNTGKTTFTDQSPTLASTLVASERNIYTITDGDYDLKAPANAFKTSNAALVSLFTTKLGVSDPAKLIQWTRGIDVQDKKDPTKEREHMGDSLHTTPALVNYSDNKQYLFVTTNDGMLHAFNVTNGGMTETFAFIPPSLLENLDTLYNNNNADNKVYGLDGNLSIWQTDNKVILYFGMRRGGDDYYALDVSIPASPKLLWHIEGGIIASNGDDFRELGQSWSTPQLTKVMNGAKNEVMALIFAGGYDNIKQDNTAITTRTLDTVGRGIFIVDATLGTKIWDAGPSSDFKLTLPSMKNSIPSDVRIIDLDGNGRADRLYVGDMGSRIWRIDLDQTNISNSSGYQLADFNGRDVAGNRRFYYAPSVSFDRNRRLMVAIGSGYRSHPAESGIDDRFYAFEDVNASIGAPSITPTALTEAALGDISGNDVTGQKAYGSGIIGWYLNMGKSEKVLAESIIFNGNVVFTSYEPFFDEEDKSTCSQNGNTPRAYMLALEDGRPVRDRDNSGKFTASDRSDKLKTVQFIPSAPYITFNKPDNANNKGTTPIIGGDKQTADLYVGKDQIDSDSFLTNRISWQNQ